MKTTLTHFLITMSNRAKNGVSPDLKDLAIISGQTTQQPVPCKRHSHTQEGYHIMIQNAILAATEASLITRTAPDLVDVHGVSMSGSNSCCLLCGESTNGQGDSCPSCWARYANEYLAWYEGQAHLILTDVLTLQALRAWIETTPRDYAGYPGDGVACPLAFYLNDLTGSFYEWCVDTEAVTEQRDLWALGAREPRYSYREFASYALPDWARDLVRRVDVFTFGSPLTKAQFLAILDELEARYPTVA